jgi:hypothetical protein
LPYDFHIPAPHSPPSFSTKVYAGESQDLKGRLDSHASKPPRDIGDFDVAIILSDARPALQSDLSDPGVRKALEATLVEYLKKEGDENFDVRTGATGTPELNQAQRATAENYREEMHFVLHKFGLLSKPPPRKVDEDEKDVRHIADLLSKTFKIGKVTQKELVIDEKQSFIRPGSPKPNGWQITLRDYFRKAVQKGEGYLVVPRGPGLLIPFERLRSLIGKDLNRATADVFIKFEPSRVTIIYQGKLIDISDCALERG